MQMLQSLLEDRFQMRVHRETRETPVYLRMCRQERSQIAPVRGWRMPGGRYTCARWPSWRYGTPCQDRSGFRRPLRAFAWRVTGSPFPNCSGSSPSR